MPFDYARIASTYDRFRGSESETVTLWVPMLRKFGEIEKGSRVLDLGCGTGRFARRLARIGTVTGLDRSAEMLREARSKPGPRWVMGDAASLPFRDGSFDCALAVMVFHQFDRKVPVVREIRRVASRVVVVTVDMQRREANVLDEAFPHLAEVDRRRFPRIGDLERLLERAPYGSVSVHREVLHRRSRPEDLIEKVRNKYISTLDLLPEGEFRQGLEFLERELPTRHPDGYEQDLAFTFLVASA